MAIKAWKKESAQAVQGGRGIPVRSYFMDLEEMEVHLNTPKTVINRTSDKVMATIGVLAPDIPKIQDMYSREWMEALVAPNNEVTRSGKRYLEISARNKENWQKKQKARV